MEFVNGVNLRQTMKAGKIAPKEALAIVTQICDALQFAHDEGIVHRDIKPENILIDQRGRAKIADFGLAKLLGQQPADQHLTATNQIMGTLRYMAPEQMEGSREVDHRADIYSLGVVFYELLTGELPIGRFAPPSKKVQIDVRLDEVVLRALEKEPEQRYQQASEVKNSVDEITSGSGSDVDAEQRTIGANRTPQASKGNGLLRRWIRLPFYTRLWMAVLAGLVIALLCWIGWHEFELLLAKKGLVGTWHATERERREIRFFADGRFEETEFPVGDAKPGEPLPEPGPVTSRGHYRLISGRQFEIAFSTRSFDQLYELDGDTLTFFLRGAARHTQFKRVPLEQSLEHKKQLLIGKWNDNSLPAGGTGGWMDFSSVGTVEYHRLERPQGSKLVTFTGKYWWVDLTTIRLEFPDENIRAKVLVETNSLTLEIYNGKVLRFARSAS
jgi:hypothetical protein